LLGFHLAAWIGAFSYRAFRDEEASASALATRRVRFPRALSPESRTPGGSKISSVPISIALVAGGLAVVNPCGFPLLPAFLSFYLGADERRLPPAPTRVLQGLLVGALVTLGFLGFFALVGLPVSYGVGAIARAVPWAGLATGAALALTGLLILLGMEPRLPAHPTVRPRRERRLGAMLLFGIGYGAASLGCTLPLFLTLIGASLSGGGKLTTFLAYGAGMALVLMALSVLIALAREGAARAVRPLLPYMNRIAGLLLLASGGYLFYYWARLHFGDTATVADDPIVSFGVRFSGQARDFADGSGSLILIGAGAIVALALLASIWQRHRRAVSPGLVRQ
jgi:cytochrome c-type biogenesis protein